MVPLLLSTTLAGVLATPHCVGMCGPFAARGGAAWHLGKLGTYAALGAAAGAAGRLILGPPWLGPAVGVFLLALASARLAGLWEPPAWGGATLAGAGQRLARRGDLLGRLGLGALSGLLPCGMVHAALAAPVIGRDPAWGALSMVAFGVATIPGLLSAQMVLAWIDRRRPLARRVVAALVFLSGLGALAARGAMPGPTPSHEVCNEVQP